MVQLPLSSQFEVPCSFICSQDIWTVISTCTTLLIDAILSFKIMQNRNARGTRTELGLKVYSQNVYSRNVYSQHGYSHLVYWSKYGRHISRSILFYPITCEGRRDTTDEFSTIPFHHFLFSAALVELAKSIPVHSLILCSHLFFCLPLFFIFLSLCPVGLSLLNQKTLRHGQTILAFVS